jgi:hypothetical protein
MLQNDWLIAVACASRFLSVPTNAERFRRIATFRDPSGVHWLQVRAG